MSQPEHNRINENQRDSSVKEENVALGHVQGVHPPSYNATASPVQGKFIDSIQRKTDSPPKPFNGPIGNEGANSSNTPQSFTPQLKNEAGADFSGKNHGKPFQLKTENSNSQSDPRSNGPAFNPSEKNSKGQMPDMVQAKMENAFGQDFSAVNIHQNSKQAEDLNAQAFTQGNDIHFAQGKYDPESQSGQELLGHELTHVVQQRSQNIAPTTQLKGANINDDEGLEKEADDMGKKVSQMKMEPVDDVIPPADNGGTGNGSIQRKTIQLSDEEKYVWKGPSTAADDIYSAVGWFSNDYKKIFQILNMCSLDDLRIIRSEFSRKHGWILERFCKEKFNVYYYKKAMKILKPVLPIFDQLFLYVDLMNENEGAMLETLRTASKKELYEAKNDWRVSALLKNSLNARELFEARKLIDPKNLYDHVVELGQNATSFFGDDEEIVFMSILELSSAQRKKLWNNNRGTFIFLDGSVPDGATVDPESEWGRFRKMCLGTEVEALQSAMDAATDGGGTFDDLVAKIAERTGSAAQQEQQLTLMLSTGKDPNGNSLSEDQIKAINSELAQLGGVRDNLLATKDDEGNVKPNEFLADLHGDVGDAEFQNYTAQMGLDDVARAKQMILDAVGVWDDNDAIFKAIEMVPPDQREALLNDAEVAQALKSNFNSSEMSDVTTFKENDTYGMMLKKIADCNGFWSEDEAGLFNVLMDASEDDRKKLREGYDQGTWPMEMIRIWIWLDQFERDAVLEILRNGKLSTEKGLQWATEGGGTDEDFFNQTLERMDANERFLARIGYAHANGMTIPPSLCPDETLHKAIEKYETLVGYMGNDELTIDEIQTSMNKLMGAPTLDEYQSEEGQKLIMFIMNQRIEDRGALRDGGFGDWFVGLFSEAPEVSDVAEISAGSMYRQSGMDGEISDEELAMMAYLENEFGIRYEEYVASVDMVAEIASTVAAMAAAIAVTIATGGAGAPAIAAALSTSGLSAGAATAGAVAIQATVAAIAAGGSKVLASEAIGGEHYDVAQEGGEDALVGGVDGAVTALTAGIGKALMARFALLKGLQGVELTSQLSVATLRAGTTSVGKRVATAGIQNAIEGVLGSVAGELLMTAMDEETWRRGIWDTVVKFGGAILRGVVIGGGTGMLMGGAFEGLAAKLGPGRAERLVKELADKGLSESQFSSMTMSQASKLGAIEDAIQAGETARARSMMASLKQEIDPALADDLERNLLDSERLEHIRRRNAGLLPEEVPEEFIGDGIRMVDQPLEESRFQRIVSNVKDRISGNDRFELQYSDGELSKIVQKGKELGLDDETIEHLIYTGSRGDKRLSAKELIDQMDNHVNVVMARGYPHKFGSLEEFEGFKNDIIDGLNTNGLPSSDVRVQGSSLRTPKANDVDLVTFVTDIEYDNILTKRFAGRISKNGTLVDISKLDHEGLLALAKHIDENPAAYNAQARTFKHAMLNRNFNSKSDILKPLKKVKKALAAKYPHLNIEAIAVQTKGGSFDMKPSMSLN